MRSGGALDEVCAGPRPLALVAVDGDRHRCTLCQRTDRGAKPVKTQVARGLKHAKVVLKARAVIATCDAAKVVRTFGMRDETLGEVLVPSGKVTVLDPGTIGLFLRGEIDRVPILTVDGLPRDRALAVMGERVGHGRWAMLWDHVDIVVEREPVATLVPVGDLVVDFARVMFADESNGEHWVHEDSIDGRADYVFWGRDAELLAAELNVPALSRGEYGWRDGAMDAIAKAGSAVESLREAKGYKLAVDFRPHSHHWQVLESIRASSTESGVVDVGPARVCVFMTSWGDGVFPVNRVVASDGRLLAVRIQLATARSVHAMQQVNT